MATFAIIQTGGKQYRVSEGDTVRIEKLSDGKKDLAAGDAVTFNEVLLIDDGSKTELGAPHIAGASVHGKVKAQGRNKKVTILKYKQKSRYKIKRGHRQPHTDVIIASIKHK